MRSSRPPTRTIVATLGLLTALAAPGCPENRPRNSRPAQQPDEPGEARATAIAPDSTHAVPATTGRPVQEEPGGAANTPDRPTDATNPGSAGSAALLAEITPPARGVTRAAPWLADAERVAAIGHGGRTYVVAAGVGWLRVFQPDGQQIASADASGGVHALEVVDSDGDGDPEIVVGRGRSRGALDAPASVTVYEFDGSLTKTGSIPLPTTPESRVAGLAAGPGGQMWILAFESKYMARLLIAEPDRSANPPRSWQVRTLDRIRVPLDVAVGDVDGDEQLDVLIARPYGETKEAPGDVFVRRADGSRLLLPTTRGARAVLIHDRQVFYADGWHYDYGRQAQALITRARWHPAAPGADLPGSFEAQVQVRVTGRHGYDRLRIGDIDGDRRADLVAAGNGPAIAVPTAEGAGEVITLGSVEARDAFPADLDGDGRDEVLIAGPEPLIWRLE